MTTIELQEILGNANRELTLSELKEIIYKLKNDTYNESLKFICGETRQEQYYNGFYTGENNAFQIVLDLLEHLPSTLTNDEKVSEKSICENCIHKEICQFYIALGVNVLCYDCGYYKSTADVVPKSEVESINPIQEAIEQKEKENKESALGVLNELLDEKDAEIKRLEYTLTGVMHFVDKWLDGEELKQDEVNRAATMREKTLRIIEDAKSEVERLFEGLYKSVASKFPMKILPIFKKDLGFEEGYIQGKCDALIEVFADIAELKKKYTESEGEE